VCMGVAHTGSHPHTRSCPVAQRMSRLIPPPPTLGRRSRRRPDATPGLTTALRGTVHPVAFFHAQWDGHRPSVRGDSVVYRSAIPDGIPNHGDPFAKWIWDGETLTITTDPTGLF